MVPPHGLQLYTIPLSASGIVLNCLLLSFAIRHRVASSSATLLLRSQAIIDLLVLLANIVFLQVQVVPRPSDTESVSTAWLLYCILGSDSTIVVWSLIDFSIYNTLAFSIERCLCICCNFWWRRHKRTLLKIFYAGILLSTNIGYVPQALIASWPQLVPTESNSSLNGSSVNFTVVCDSRALIAPESALRVLSIVSISVTIGIPTAGMLFCYSAIIIQLRRSAAMSKTSSKKSDIASRRFTAIVGLTVAAFVMCNLPDCIRYMIWSLDPEAVHLPEVVTEFLFPQISTLNSLVNPVIYLLFHRQFTRFAFCQARACTSQDNNKGTQRGCEPAIATLSSRVTQSHYELQSPV